MKIKLVLHDWINVHTQKSVYAIDEEYSTGDLHSGTTFKAVVHGIDADDLDRIRAAKRAGSSPVFMLFLEEK